MESVNCGANIGLMTWHAGILRAKFDKLGMIAIAGPPNVGKTKELKVSNADFKTYKAQVPLKST